MEEEKNLDFFEGLENMQLEWLLINASKELLSMVKPNANIQYNDAIKFAKENIPEILTETKIGKGRLTKSDKLKDKFLQEAEALSRRDNKSYSYNELIENRIAELTNLIKVYKPNEKEPSQLKEELRNLKVIQNNENTSYYGFEKITENQAIINDAFADRLDKRSINKYSGKANIYANHSDGSKFRIEILHPNPTEAILGADLIYEQYNITNDKVRIVAIQYKMWENEVLYFSQAGNLKDQLKKMDKFFCKNKFCQDQNGSNQGSETYRLPFCAAFLRPTDKLHDPNKLLTSGYHVPICKIDSIINKTTKTDKLEYDLVKNTALKADTFEELFKYEMVGSPWIETEALEDFFKVNKILEPKQKIILHAQKYYFYDDDDEVPF